MKILEDTTVGLFSVKEIDLLGVIKQDHPQVGD